MTTAGGSERRLACLDQLVEELAREVADRAEVVLRERLDGLVVDRATSPYLSVGEAAELLRAKPQRIYDLASSSRLSKFKDGTRTLLLRSEIEDMLNGKPTGPVASTLPPGARSRTGSEVTG